MEAFKNDSIILGTAQLGGNYGICASNLNITQQNTNEILELFKYHGSSYIDTAQSYGNSEVLLGNAGLDNLNIITKINSHSKNIRDSICKSLERLKQESLYAVMVHDASGLYGSEGSKLWSSLERCREEGLIEKIGVSIYSPSDLEKIIPTYPVEIVQSPFNILDRRLIQSGWYEKLNGKNIELHIRSVFLQGLLLLGKKFRPKYYAKWNIVFGKYDQLLLDLKISALSLCLNYALTVCKNTNIVVGVNSKKELIEIYKAVNLNKKLDIDKINLLLETSDEMLIDPRNWKLN